MRALKQLALTRILFFTLTYIFVARLPHFDLWAQVPMEFWNPSGLFNLIENPAILFSYQSLIVTLWRFSFLMAIFGVGYKFAAPFNVALGFLAINFASSFATDVHIYLPVVLASIPLALSSASEIWSVDCLLKKPSVVNDGGAKRALFNMQLVFCLVYFSAGLSKVWHGGMAWVWSNSLRNYFLAASINYLDVNKLAQEVSLNLYLYSWPMLCRMIALAVVILELAAPLALLRRRYTLFIVLALALFQVGAYFTIFVNFSSYIPLFSIWIPVTLNRFREVA